MLGPGDVLRGDGGLSRAKTGTEMIETASDLELGMYPYVLFLLKND